MLPGNQTSNLPMQSRRPKSKRKKQTGYIPQLSHKPKNGGGGVKVDMYVVVSQGPQSRGREMKMAT